MSKVSLYILYADTTQRRESLRATYAPERYRLYGLFDLEKRGYLIKHNLERPPADRIATLINRFINQLWRYLGGYGGDWFTVLRSLIDLNRADIIISTVDRVGIPVMILRALGLLQTPVIYISIGLPERLKQLKNQRMHSFYRRSFQSSAQILCYGYVESIELRKALLMEEQQIKFIPFGVDAAAIRPMNSKIEFDVISVGADLNRDFSLLTKFGKKHSQISIKIITTSFHINALGNVPNNISLSTNLTLEDTIKHLDAAQLVVLPIKPNSYSGGTTVLLQAMALGKPVLVSRVAAIENGYHLVDGVNCKFIEPESNESLENTILAMLEDPEQCKRIGDAARATVEQCFTWPHYVEHLSHEISSGLHKN